MHIVLVGSALLEPTYDKHSLILYRFKTIQHFIEIMIKHIQPNFLKKKTLAAMQKMDNQSIFKHIYQQHFWGQHQNNRFYSGDGSHDKKQVKPYIHAIRQFILSLKKTPIIVDLGCGDFAIGEQLMDLASQYKACDIVPELIQYNQQHFTQDQLSFHCLDASKENLPTGDILIIRQVFQHLSNAAIKAIMEQFSFFKYLIVTEHIPSQDFVANKDKMTGPDSRLRIKSGIDLMQPPFSLTCKDQRILCTTYPDNHFGGIIQTQLFIQ